MLKQIRELLLILLGSMALWSHLAAADELIVPDQYLTITSALTAAASIGGSNTIVLKEGTYNEHITLIDNVTLQGDITAQTALTIIDGGGAGTVITAARGSVIQWLTITNGNIGIAIPGSATEVTVNNNIITKHDTAGIQCTSATSPDILNNTLDSNGTAITCTSSSGVTIKNNIISNGTANDISLDQSTLDNSPENNRNFNLFFNNANEDYVDTQLRNQDLDLTNNIFEPKVDDANPLFVNPNNNDFHLKEGSPAITAGINGTEIGVYGNGNNDPPFPVTNLRVTATDQSSITIAWDPNLAYNVQGYNVYYNIPDQPSTLVNLSPIVDTTYPISGLSGYTPQTPPVPPNLTAGIGDSELRLSWSPVTPVTVSDYRIYYGTTPSIYDVTIDIPDRSRSSYNLTGLVNGTPYYIAIEAVATPVYFVTVKVFDGTTESNATEVEAHLTGPEVLSGVSSEISATPEPPVRFPNLSNEGGCFIATAAYDSPLEPHVQTLRTFRDRYLLTNSLGRRLVAVYYPTSPPLARWLEEHASFKPVVRAILSPIVFATEIWMNAEPFGQLLIIVLFLSLVGFSVYRLGTLRWGGHY